MDSSSNDIGNLNFTPPSAPLFRLTLLAALLALSILAGCGVDTASNEEPVPVDPEFTSIVIEVDFAAAIAALTNMLTDPLFNAATAADVNTASVQAYQPFPNSVGFADMLQKPGSSSIWSGILTDLPVGVALDIEVEALDTAGFVVFEGFMEDVVLTGSEDPNTPSETISIIPAPASTDVPVINGITMDGCALPISECEVPIGGTRTVRIDVAGLAVGAGLPPDELTITFVDSDPPGAFTPNTRLLILEESGLPAGIPAFIYTAPTTIPSTPEFRAQRVRVTNKRGFFVEQPFNLKIVNSTTVALNFAPVVTGFSASREAGTGNVTWQATVNDDQDAPTALTHSWSFIQTSALPLSPTFDPLAGGADNINPGGMVLYDETVEGTVTLNVTDSGGATSTVTIPVAAGMLPDIPTVGL